MALKIGGGGPDQRLIGHYQQVITVLGSNAGKLEADPGRRACDDCEFLGHIPSHICGMFSSISMCSATTEATSLAAFFSAGASPRSA